MKRGPLFPTFPWSATRDAGLVVSMPHTFLVLMREGAENKAAAPGKGNAVVMNYSQVLCGVTLTGRRDVA